MRQRPETFDTADEDPDATLVTPRFDEDDARRAHPVVPLDEARPKARRTRRRWMPALLAVALLAVAALGGALAMKMMQGPRAERAQEETQPAPVQAAEAPAQTQQQPATPHAADAPREDAPAVKPEAHTARTRRARTEPAPVVAEDDDAEPRGKASEKRRERDDDLEKEMRKALKRAAKGKAPRLVGVLTGPEQ